MLAVESPLEAYRSDLERNPGQEDFGSSDTLWLLVAHCLSRVARAANATQAALAVTCANALREFTAPQSLAGDEQARNLDLLSSGLRNLESREGADALSRAVRGFAAQMCDAGALSTGFTTIAFARQISRAASDRERGLLAADQARVARQLGDLETAHDLYLIAEGIGERAADAGLLARVNVGRGVIARVRGNYPSARTHFERSLEFATEAGSEDLLALAHQGLMVTSIIGEDYDAALRHGWRAYELARGDAQGESEALGNLAHICMVTGHPRAALSGFMAALSRAHALRFRLPHLGSAVLSAARCGEMRTLQRLTRDLERTIECSALPYENAQGYLYLAQAYAAIGNVEQSNKYREHTRRIAKARGFFEVMHAIQPEQFDRHFASGSIPATVELAPASKGVVDSLGAMQVDEDVVVLVSAHPG